MEVPQKTKVDLPYDPAIPLLGFLSKEDENTNLKIYMHSDVHCSIIHNSQNMETTIHQWMKGQRGGIYTMEYYLTMRKKGILPFVTTWMDLEGTVLSEISPTEEDKYCIISLICGI